MYHETFWVAASAAAPVTALASIVALSDITSWAHGVLRWEVDHPPWTFPNYAAARASAANTSSAYHAAMVMLICVLNTILQAVILAFALSSLTSRVDEMPTAVAIAAEVAGIAALTTGAIIGALSRGEVIQMMKCSVQPPDWYKEGWP
jgi:hypothetical protein